MTENEICSYNSQTVLAVLGRPIAKMMSEKLGREYYDRDIVEQAAKKLNLSCITY